MSNSRPSLSNTVYLCAPVNALVEGIFEQKIGFSKILEHGDFGLGTFDRLDGEMVLLDGVIYQIDGQGRVRTVDADQASTPFACVTFFQPISYETIVEGLSYADFQQWLLQLMPSPNLFYAFRIEGLFNNIRVRSVSKQDSLRPLVAITAEQSVFSYQDVRGTVSGFYTPAFMASLNVPGLHLHYLAANLSAGGHLLSCEPQNVTVAVQMIPQCLLALPITLDYLTCDFQRDTAKDLEKAEK